MSLVFDKGKFKYYNDIEQLKPKYNNSNVNIGKNNQKKNNIKNTPIYNENDSSSPFRNITNNNKNTCLTTYQNYSIIKNNNKEQNQNNKKGINSKKLKYNKSFEGNLMNNDLIFSNNFGFSNDDLYNHGKFQGNKKFNNSVILNNKQNKAKNKNKSNNKSVTKTINAHSNMNNKKNNFDENFVIKKLDEKFKSLENNIIDKKYENDIDHDEMIISSHKKNYNHKNNNTNYNSNTFIKTVNKTKNKKFNLSDLIDEVNINSINNTNNKNDNKIIEDNFDHCFLYAFNNNKNQIDIDETYLLNTSFENNRNDFNIMYTDNYGDTIPNDMLSLEIKLLIEKMLELQKSYHKELKLIINQYNNNQALFKILIEKIKHFHKKMFLIKKIQETENINGNIYNFLGVYNHNNQHEINKINKKEFFIWNKIMRNNDGNVYNKEKIKELFIKVIFEKYNKLLGKLNNIENKIIINLMKKYKYNPNNKKKDGIMKYNGSIGNINNDINNDKNKVNSASPIQIYKNIIKQNNKTIINSNVINKKKKHKKTASCCAAKPSKYIYFKNSKQK